MGICHSKFLKTVARDFWLNAFRFFSFPYLLKRSTLDLQVLVKSSSVVSLLILAFTSQSAQVLMLNFKVPVCRTR